MKIEVLFPEVCNLYGDLFNIKYLKECLPEAEVVNTSLKDEPLFVKEMPALIYMGTTTERGQVLAIEALSKYKEQIKKAINEGVAFLVTGNAVEIFCKTIYEEGEKVAEGLGIFDFETKRKARKRFNSLYLGEFSDGEEVIKIVGFKSLFGYVYGDNKGKELFMTERGDGFNPDIKEEGLRVNNFFATQITGPLFVLNPIFTKWFIKNILKVENPSLAHEEAAIDSYMDRLAEYTNTNTGFYY